MGTSSADDIAVCEIPSRVDVAWCRMLYGRMSKVMAHLSSALLRPAALRQEVKPILAVQNFSFTNILFVTQQSVDEDALMAGSFFGSFQMCTLPW